MSSIYAEAMKTIAGVGDNNNQEEELIESDGSMIDDLEQKLQAAIASKSLGQTRVTVKLNNSATAPNTKIADPKKAK